MRFECFCLSVRVCECVHTFCIIGQVLRLAALCNNCSDIARNRNAELNATRRVQTEYRVAGSASEYESLMHAAYRTSVADDNPTHLSLALFPSPSLLFSV